MSVLRVAVIGAAGRMGSAACRWIDSADDLQVVARIHSGTALHDELRGCECTVAIDLTRAPLGFEHGLAMLECGVRPVIGTSGVDSQATTELDRVARELGLGGIVVPNFSLGMWLLQRAAELAAHHLSRFEVIEMHHQRKVDAPSGTAVETAERLAAAAGLDPASVPIHSVRLPGATANQEVVFGGEGEWLRLRHETYGLECYAPGVLAALRFVTSATGVARGIGAAFGDTIREG